ncbi:MAG: siroheme synthase CysG [Gemmatimonadaceae bacterium]
MSLDLRGREAVVIGGGALAEAKTVGLVEAGARVVVIAQTPSDRIAGLAQSGAITLRRREFRTGDLGAAFLAIAALESAEERALHSAIWREAEAKRILLNAADDAQHCHFIAPAIHRHGLVSVAVSTSGASPALAVRLRDDIARRLGPEYGELAEILSALRADVARAIPDSKQRARLWKRIVDSNAHRLVRAAGSDTARQRIATLVSHAAAGESIHTRASRTRGTVYLVGAGPGAPELLTLRGRHALRRADVVVYDRLVDPRVLRIAPVNARRIYVGKRPGAAGEQQTMINRRLVRLARRHEVVVRLKGGDPFVFGRGGEECAALRAAGVRVHVVPGVSAAVAAPAAAHIPLTQRGVASAFAVVSARGADDSDPLVDWGALARIPTVVVLMAFATLDHVSAQLIAHGKRADTPAAVIARATLPDERIVHATLGTIARTVAATRNMAAPATLIVGDVVRLGITPNRGQL